MIDPLTGYGLHGGRDAHPKAQNGLQAGLSGYGQSGFTGFGDSYLCSTVRFENDTAKVAAIVSNVTVRLCAVAVDICAVIEVSEHD
jgi:hypothetical protein